MRTFGAKQVAVGGVSGLAKQDVAVEAVLNADAAAVDDFAVNGGFGSIDAVNGFGSIDAVEAPVNGFGSIDAVNGGFGGIESVDDFMNGSGIDVADTVEFRGISPIYFT